MSRFKPHIALLICNIVWAMDYPFYNIVLPHYVHPMAMVAGSLVVTALFSLVPLLWQKAERVARADIRKLIGAALLIGVLRKVFIMYGLSMTSPIDGSIIDTIVPLLVLLLSVLLGMDRFTELKVAGLLLGMAGAVAVVLTGASSSHQHSHVWGNVMIMLCACATALYMVWFKALVARYRITTVLRWVYCVAAVVALPFGLKEIIHTDYAAIAGHALFPTLFVLTVLLALPAVLSILCDWRVNGRIVWSGYSVGGAALLYVMVVLPLWFRRPNPVIFVPVDFAAIGLYLLYINFATGGHWFLTFAFPVTGAIGLLVSGTVALLHYLRRGQLFVIGGALILGGGVTVLIEYLLNLTFHVGRVFFWSVYPLSAGVVLGVTLLVVGFCKPLRRSLHRKFFL